MNGFPFGHSPNDAGTPINMCGYVDILFVCWYAVPCRKGCRLCTFSVFVTVWCEIHTILLYNTYILFWIAAMALHQGLSIKGPVAFQGGKSCQITRATFQEHKEIKARLHLFLSSVQVAHHFPWLLMCYNNS